MNDRMTARRTVLFAAFLLLAGIANALSRTGDPAVDALMAGCNYLVFMGLLIYWL